MCGRVCQGLNFTLHTYWIYMFTHDDWGGGVRLRYFLEGNESLRGKRYDPTSYTHKDRGAQSGVLRVRGTRLCLPPSQDTMITSPCNPLFIRKHRRTLDLVVNIEKYPSLHKTSKSIDCMFENLILVKHSDSDTHTKIYKYVLTILLTPIQIPRRRSEGKPLKTRFFSERVPK